jgi:hypothetical protein
MSLAVGDEAGGTMKSSVTIALILVGLVAACGGDKQSGKPSGNAASSALATPAAVLAAAEDRTTAMCGCADPACRTAVMSRPDDPFGERGRAARDGFSADQRTRWNDVMQRWAACSIRK